MIVLIKRIEFRGFFYLLQTFIPFTRAQVYHAQIEMIIVTPRAQPYGLLHFTNSLLRSGKFLSKQGSIPVMVFTVALIKTYGLFEFCCSLLYNIGSTCKIGSICVE